ncbi:type I-E CRISPR-associated protein Cse1/CasA [Streptomyces bohaiensis]|uniref:Type I-E CRISPR-associated protein Cse1/CasA n=1 Tax=Streptomyces bohaiensis TaxID=1431344 RepID=A0ABX1CAY8_9ACTN|nr:type I-E CRISPR-associated protein Cse1/CasA [Streptomyces bohaiensis]
MPVFSSGQTLRASLREVFLRAHEWEGLAIALPPAAAGVMRILYAMTARITGLDRLPDGQVDAWLDRRYECLADGQRFDAAAVDRYFDQHAAGLRLHDPDRPFLQDPRLAAECPKFSGVNKLVMARPAGNNQVFFGHFTDAEQVSLPSAEAVLHLISQLYYGPSGQCTPRVVDGQRFGNTSAGPLRRTLSCHPAGRSLYETLILGLPVPSATSDAEAERDLCPWEHDGRLDALRPAATAPGTRAQLTARQQHAVLLTPGAESGTVSDAVITWALRTKRPEEMDPYLIWDELKDGTRVPRYADADRALWRDLDGMILESRHDGRRPPVFDTLTGSQLPEPVFRKLHVVAYGFDQDGQTRDRTYFSATTPPIFRLLSEAEDGKDAALAVAAREARDAAEKAAWHLTTALRSAWREYTLPFQQDAKKDKDGPWPAQALAAYWPAAEARFWQLLDEGDLTAPRKKFGRLALDAFDRVTASVASQPRGARARKETRGLVASLLSDKP